MVSSLPAQIKLSTPFNSQFKKKYLSMNGRQETHAVVKAPRQDAGYMKLASENMKTASLEEGFQARDEMWQAKEDLLFEDLGALSLSTSMISIAARTKGKGRNNNATTGLEGQTRTKNIKHIEGILDNLSSQRYISLPFPTQEDYPGATSATNSNNVRQILAPPPPASVVIRDLPSN